MKAFRFRVHDFKYFCNMDEPPFSSTVNPNEGCKVKETGRYLYEWEDSRANIFRSACLERLMNRNFHCL